MAQCAGLLAKAGAPLLADGASAWPPSWMRARPQAMNTTAGCPANTKIHLPIGPPMTPQRSAVEKADQNNERGHILASS